MSFEKQGGSCRSGDVRASGGMASLEGNLLILNVFFRKTFFRNLVLAVHHVQYRHLECPAAPVSGPRLREIPMLIPVDVRISLITLLLFWSSLSPATPTLEVIDLRHREAQALIPLLQPLLPADARLSGRGFQLIVRAEPATLAEIRRLLARLDTPPDNLLVSVRFSEAAVLDRSRARVGGGVVIGDERVRGGGGAVLEQRRSQWQGRVDQQLRVLDGYEALIQVSEETLRRSYWGDYLDAAVTGFRVRPRMSGNRVTLTLAAQRERPGRRRSAGAAAETVLSGQLGEWLPVALSTGGELTADGGAAREIFMWVRVQRL